jgi:alkaline phosphatase D
LGPTQLEWFKKALVSSNAPFKIVSIGGQFLTTNENHETYQHYHRAEHDSILAFIERENIKNVIFLTGDRHFTELSKVTNAKGNDLYDLTTSSLTAGIYADAKKEQNNYRVDGTLVTVHNFATLHFSGPRKARVLEIKVFSADGKEAFSHSIKSQQ